MKHEASRKSYIAAQVLHAAHAMEADWPDAHVDVYSPGGYCVYSSPDRPIGGYTVEDFIGHHWKEFIDPSDWQHGEITIADALMHDQSVEVHGTAIQKNGTRVRVLYLVCRAPGDEPFWLVRSLELPKGAR